MKKVLVLLLTLVLAVGVALPAAPVYARQAVAVGEPLRPVGTVYAVVVGINAYPGHPLDFPVADAEAFQLALTDKYSVPSENIKLLRDDEATKDKILAAITGLGSTSSDDVIIYFSGHGTTGRRSLNGIVAYDGVIWSGELRATIRGITANRIVVILDCCYGNGFANDLNLPNMLAMMSSAGLSWEPSLFGHGIFTYWFLVKGIIQGLADNPAENRYATPDGKIPFEEAFDYAFQNMTHQKPKVVDNVALDFWPDLGP